MIKGKDPPLGGRKITALIKGIINEDWPSVMMIGMNQSLMQLSLGNRNNHGFLILFRGIKKREELPIRVFIPEVKVQKWQSP